MNVKEKLIHLLEGTGYTQKRVATKTGLSTAVISQYLKGVYNGNISNVESAIADFISREEERARRREVKESFVQTTLSGLGLGLISNTHMDGDIGVIHGPAGMGKSIILKRYVATNKGAILIEADPGYTAKVLLQELCARLGVKKTGNIDELSEECIQALTGTGWVVLVDEAELLPYRALKVLRRIHDRSGVAIVLAGMPRLLINLKGSRGEFAQLYSRVGMALDLEAHNGKSEVEDFNTILASLLPDEGDGDVISVPGVAEAFLKYSKGNYRRMFKLARCVVRASAIGNQGISVKLIETYAQLLIH
ncbi:AAA family ATPase [Erwinia tracheiphila]|uniref:XRE family transcriptional regulator n=1 Tax=Erwinia tracheiphila TaxID=65700 RepID=A0A0M2KJ13_9GAMM|nr:AAA family ATPase [Erwinia tracheiphila]EOS95507.1 DNA transposition protein [Erwinia tracheiphila PSU-1]KKF37238.1 XRE family transcriptional regulator [Erwinia tracheiphila]UIA88631.1 AAA family ATPase [Erwinia tracheiphila]UIA97011.1 AAA family ATPase [Erwinia tracheiphila]